jgi:hypothetical protein
MTWLALWTAVFFAALAAFTIVSALVAVRGWGEVRELFTDLEAAALLAAPPPAKPSPPESGPRAGGAP